MSSSGFGIRILIAKHHSKISREGRVQEQYENSKVLPVVSSSSSSSSSSSNSFGYEQIMMGMERKNSALNMSMRAMLGDGTYLQTPIPMTKLFGPCVSRESIFDIENLDHRPQEKRASGSGNGENTDGRKKRKSKNSENKDIVTPDSTAKKTRKKLANVNRTKKVNREPWFKALVELHKSIIHIDSKKIENM